MDTVIEIELIGVSYFVVTAVVLTVMVVAPATDENPSTAPKPATSVAAIRPANAARQRRPWRALLLLEWMDTGTSWPHDPYAKTPCGDSAQKIGVGRKKPVARDYASAGWAAFV